MSFRKIRKRLKKQPYSYEPIAWQKERFAKNNGLLKQSTEWNSERNSVRLMLHQK